MALPISKWLTSTIEHFRQILGQGADFQLEQDVFQRAAAGLDAHGLADGFHRHHDGDLFVLGDFVQIDVEHLVGQDVVLDFLHQRQALGLGIALRRTGPAAHSRSARRG